MFQEWLINQPLLDFFSAGIEGESIVVGIPYDPIHKWDEFSPWVNNQMYRWMNPYDANRIEGGDGAAYLEFLLNTLKPNIDGRYRSLQDQENTFIGGYDMGGLISLYAGLTRPDVFSLVMIMSPAVWFAEDEDHWLSRNRLIDLINISGISKDVTFFINMAVEDRTTDLVVRPVIYDSQG